MSEFKKKPVVIEAVQWKDGEIKGGAPDWLIDALNKPPREVGSVIRIGNNVHIYTLEGTIVASDGDWIIKGVNNELYPCKPDIFEKTYDAV